jgi:hypothetical protein
VHVSSLREQAARSFSHPAFTADVPCDTMASHLT